MKFFWLLNKAVMAPETGGEGSGGGGGGSPDNKTTDVPNDPPAEDPPKDGDTLSNTEATLLKDVMKWKSRFKTQAEEITGIRSELDKVSVLQNVIGDLDIDELKALVGSKKDSERKEQEKRGEYDSIIDQMREEHTRDMKSNTTLLEEKDTAYKGLESQLLQANKNIEDLTIGRSFSDSEFITKECILDPDIARQIFGENFEIEQGQIVAYQKPSTDGDKAPLVDSQGNKLGFEAAIERLITSHPKKDTLLRAKIKAGAGSNTASGKPSEPATELRGKDRIAAALKAKS